MQVDIPFSETQELEIKKGHKTNLHGSSDQWKRKISFLSSESTLKMQMKERES